MKLFTLIALTLTLTAAANASAEKFTQKDVAKCAALFSVYVEQAKEDLDSAGVKSNKILYESAWAESANTLLTYVGEIFYWIGLNLLPTHTSAYKQLEGNYSNACHRVYGIAP
ncbi:hypothetical protein J2X84_002269 [Pseudomonas corrugata]|uniref:hypothetical protein n=1 Tax=Pseudomonas corrugata TaxID=47879 RepID=UPI00285E4A06|nr:hypothetical protein [Pseudomonas corrugata]MDR7283445.1 hypothetical protein [Pseudomonas corrugata]